MKRLLIAVSVFLMMGSVSYAQVTPDIHKGSKALLFTFDGLDTIRANNFDGGAGVKWFMNDMTAIRGSLQFTKAHADVLPGAPVVAPNTATNGNQDGSRVGVTVALERHLSTMRVSPIIGAGVGFATSSTESSNAVVGNPPGAQTVVKNAAGGENVNGNAFTGGTTFQGFGFFGFEFFLTKEVSFSAEYRLGFAKTSRKDQETTTGATTTTLPLAGANVFGIASTGVFTMGIYF